MLLYIVTYAIIYLILIFLLHKLYLYFQKNLTSTKIIDYYNFPNNEYSKINNILNSNNNSVSNFNENKITNHKVNEKLNSLSNTDTSVNINFGNLEKNIASNTNNYSIKNNNDNMKSELEEFLNNLNK